jgi:hypothetical protein
VNPVVSAADVEWIDRYGEALVRGHRFVKADILRLEVRGDRRVDGRLMVAARQRIADVLTVELRDRVARALAAWQRARDRPASYRDCDG